MRGKVRKISLPRRLIIDLMHASRGVPFVSLSRSLNIRPLVGRPRGIANDRPAGPRSSSRRSRWWPGTNRSCARSTPNGRGRASMSCRAAWRWSRSRASRMARIACCRSASPARTRCRWRRFDALIRHAKQAPIDEVPMFRKIMLATRLPLAAAPPGLAGRAQFRPPARQLFRQFRRHRGRGLRRRRAARAEPGARTS